MPHPLSPLGIAHTAISLLPVVAGLYSFIRYQAIDTSKRSGQVYLAGLSVSVFTAFGLSSSGGFNPGHALGILALLAAFGSLLVTRLSFLGRLRPYLATFGLSFSFFLTMIPGTVETLTRLPAAQPFASGPESPVVRAVLLTWVTSLLVGFALQARALRLRHRKATGN